MPDPLVAEDIAEAIVHAIELPAHVNLDLDDDQAGRAGGAAQGACVANFVPASSPRRATPASCNIRPSHARKGGQSMQLERDRLDAGWRRALRPVEAELAALDDFLGIEAAAGRGYLPAGPTCCGRSAIRWRTCACSSSARTRTPPRATRSGWAFAVERAVRPLPRSLKNIFRELHDDLGVPCPDHGDLTPWAAHGVMLLNRVLTVQPGIRRAPRQGLGGRDRAGHPRAGRARKHRWSSILWGRDARALGQPLGGPR